MCIAPNPLLRELMRNTTYTCPMRPEVQQDHPGACPKCGMALEPMRDTTSPNYGENAELRDMTSRFCDKPEFRPGHQQCSVAEKEVRL